MSERALKSYAVLVASYLSFLSGLAVLLFCEGLLSELNLLSLLRLDRDLDLLL